VIIQIDGGLITSNSCPEIRTTLRKKVTYNFLI